MTQAIAKHAGSIQIGHDASFAHKILAAIARKLDQRRTGRELQRLDDRMLDDIGLTRGDIEFVAAQTTGTRGTGAPAASLWTRLMDQVRMAGAQARTARDLAGLSDRMLADIGIERGQIQEVALTVAAKSALAGSGLSGRAIKGELRTRSHLASSPVHDLLRRTEDAIRPLRQWQISRVAAGQMARLNHETLTDLGYVKGDVDWVPEDLANRKLARPANGNQSRRGVA